MGHFWFMPIFNDTYWLSFFPKLSLVLHLLSICLISGWDLHRVAICKDHQDRRSLKFSRAFKILSDNKVTLYALILFFCAIWNPEKTNVNLYYNVRKISAASFLCILKHLRKLNNVAYFTFVVVSFCFQNSFGSFWQISCIHTHN